MHDSGERKTSSTGAQSDPSHANAAMELLSPYSLWQLSTWLGKGAEKYAPRNWEKGIPFSVCVGKLQRHLAEYMMGKIDEPHLDAVGFWWHALTHYEAMIKLDKLPASLNDLPQYEKQREDNKSEEVGKFTIIKAQDTHKGWYIMLTKTLRTIAPRFLQRDLEVHTGTGWDNSYACGCAPGYYDNKEHAKSYIRMYENKPFVIPEGWIIKFNSATKYFRAGGWFVNKKDTCLCLHKSGQMQGGTAWQRFHKIGEAPGYWLTEDEAKQALKQYLEK